MPIPILRGLAKRRGFTAVAVTTIAVAIAGNAAIFSVINAVLLEPLPFAEPKRLVTLDVRSTQGFYISTSIPNYRDWGERSRVFEAYGASAGWGQTMTGRGQARVLRNRAVLGEFFDVLGMTPALGRLIPAAETGPGAQATAVLGHGFWMGEYGGDPEALGQRIVLDDRPYTIVGVLPEGAGYPSSETAVYFPMGVLTSELPWDERTSSFGTRAVARLASGVSLDAAQRDLDRVAREIRALEGQPVDLPEVRSLVDFFVGDVKTALWILMGAVAFVLLIAAANVGSLLLARGEDRRREIAVRTALGARRGALVRQLLGESLVLATVGGILGLMLAYGVVGVLRPLLPDDIPTALLARVQVDGAVALFTLALVGCTTLLFGLAPALKTSAVGLAEELKEGVRGTSAGRQRLRAALVIGEVALAVVLLIGAGLMLRSLDRLYNADKGFVAENVMTARTGLSSDRYDDGESWLSFYEELLTRAQGIPGVRSAALTLLVPLSGRSWEMGILPGNVPYDPQETESVLVGVVSEDYFVTMGVPIVAGRAFRETDRNGTTPVAIIDETMAQRFWPGEDPIGKRVTGFDFAPESTHNNPIPVYRTVVGVAKNVRHYELQSPSRIQIYVPHRQTLGRWGMGFYVTLKTSGPPGTVVAPLRRELRAMDPDVPMYAVQPLTDYVDRAASNGKAVTVLLTAFGTLALILATIGIFGVMSYAVVRRLREIGIRMALGADGPKLVRWVARQGLTPTVAGIAIGLLAAAGVTTVLDSLLYEVSPLDPAIYGSLPVLLLAVSLLAAYLPARRATRVDPVRVLRDDG